MFFRFFDISLIALYFFCGYLHLAAYPYINSSGDSAFLSDKNLPSKTFFSSIAVSKHYQNLNNIRHDNAVIDAHIDSDNSGKYEGVNIIYAAGKPFNRPAIVPLNKAPPLS